VNVGSHDRVTSRVGMKDLRRSREPPQLPQPFARRDPRGRCVLRFGAGADRVTCAGGARPREAARGCTASLPAAIRVYHTHLDSEDGVDGLFDAREVPLA